MFMFSKFMFKYYKIPFNLADSKTKKVLTRLFYISKGIFVCLYHISIHIIIHFFKSLGINLCIHFSFLSFLSSLYKTLYNRYDCVTLLFSGIVGFGKYCADNTDADGAMKIVKMLNELYTIFDSLTDSKRNSNVYKVSVFSMFTSIFSIYYIVIENK